MAHLYGYMSLDLNLGYSIAEKTERRALGCFVFFRLSLWIFNIYLRSTVEYIEGGLYEGSTPLCKKVHY